MGEFDMMNIMDKKFTWIHWVKKIGPYLILLIVPLFIFQSSVARLQRHVHWWMSTDASYAYYFTYVSFIQDGNVQMYQHPGTPQIVISTAVLRGIGYFKGLSDKALVDELLDNAEYYMFICRSVLVGLACFMLYVFGIFLYRIGSNVGMAVASQIAPFLLSHFQMLMNSMKPENLLLIAALMLSMIVLSLYRFDFNQYKKTYIVLFAIVLGFGMASKINFLTLLVIPIILIPGLKNKFYFSILTVFSFVVFTLPIIPKYGKLIKYYIKRSHRPGVVPSTRILSDWNLVRNSLFFYICLAACIILLLVFIIQRSRFKQPIYQTTKKILLAVIAASFAAIILGIIHPTGPAAMFPRYLLPALSLTGLMIFLLLYSLKQMIRTGWLRTVIIGGIICVTCVWWLHNSAPLMKKIQGTKTLSHQILDFREKMDKITKDGTVIIVFTKRRNLICHPAHSYLFGIEYTQFHLVERAKQRFPNVYFLPFQKPPYRNFNYRPVSVEKIMETNTNLFLYQQDSVSFPPTLKKYFNRKLELRFCKHSLYRLVRKDSAVSSKVSTRSRFFHGY